MSSGTDPQVEENLIKDIKKSQSSSDVISTILQTDERVIARVTDGIYRQPGSAIRELISNAYDADATRVVIKTDAPRFDRISIEDNGIGMGPEALAHMLLHIGGSAKRQEIGKELGITDSHDAHYSPSGRKLIGKIGIGIFSIAQLTHTFQIITKKKGDKYRTIASVVSKQYSDDSEIKVKDHGKYESGKVEIWREKVRDIETQGTTIVLTGIKPQTRDTLRSKEIWAGIDHGVDSPDEYQNIEPPKYHIGRVDDSGHILKKYKGAVTNLPWKPSDSPEKSFQKLVDSVWNELQVSNPNPQLDKIFDYYLQMIWQISLSIPIPYVEEHPFDLKFHDIGKCFVLSNEPKGMAKSLPIGPKQPIREVISVKEGESLERFDVFVDDLKLFRPIKFKDLPVSGHSITYPLMFIGKCREEFKGYDRELSGGPLEFEAYLFWTPRVAPAEHRGVLIRVNGASGTLFDSSFLRYQVSEQTRLRQIVCEIFIREGFDSALNIDRESFNFSHPHSAFLTRWLHSALRQLATAQKRVAGEIRKEDRIEAKVQKFETIKNVVTEVWKKENNDGDSAPPAISFLTEKDSGKKTAAGDFAFERSAIFTGKEKKAELELLEEKLKAITQVLASFGLLDNLTRAKQERLLKAIYQILETIEQ